MQEGRLDAEQVLCRRLSVFAGSFTLEAAEAVCSGEGIDKGEVAALLSGLVDRSQGLVQAHGPEMRYRVPEPLPQEVPERLVVIVQPDALRRLHAVFYSALAEQAWQGSPGPRRAGRVDRLEREHEHLHASPHRAVRPAAENPPGGRRTHSIPSPRSRTSCLCCRGFNRPAHQGPGFKPPGPHARDFNCSERPEPSPTTGSTPTGPPPGRGCPTDRGSRRRRAGSTRCPAPAAAASPRRSRHRRGR
jgi:hypothetical protein